REPIEPACSRRSAPEPPCQARQVCPAARSTAEAYDADTPYRRAVRTPPRRPIARGRSEYPTAPAPHRSSPLRARQVRTVHKATASRKPPHAASTRQDRLPAKIRDGSIRE